EAVRNGLAGLGDTARDELGAIALEQIRRSFQHRSALSGRRLAPARCERARRSQRALRGARVRKLGDADDEPAVGGSAALLRRARDVLAVDARPRAPATRRGCGERFGELRKIATRSEVRATRVVAL